MSLSRHPLTPSAKALESVPLDRAVTALLASSFRTIQSRGQAFADRFYATLFAAYPGIRPMFPVDMTAQKGKLLDMLATVMVHLADPQSNLSRLHDLGKRHKNYGAKPEHYPLVTGAMLKAMGETAAEDWNATVEAEWKRALELISRVMTEGAEHPKA